MRFSSTRRSQSKEPKQEFNDSFELSQFSTISELLAGAQSDILEIFNSQNSSNKAKL